MHHRRTIRFHPHRVLDPDSGWTPPPEFQAFEVVLSELRYALGDVAVMAQLRSMLIPSFIPAAMTDEEVLRGIAWMVMQGRAAIRDASAGGGDLP